MMRIEIDPSGAVEEDHSQSTREVAYSIIPAFGPKTPARISMPTYVPSDTAAFELMPWPWRKPTDIDGHR
jgi:hypothetical protein